MRRGLEHRDDAFLEIARTRVFGMPDNPYLPLLRHAGCDFADLRALVSRHGLDGALERLAAAGVYLASDEYKGKKPVVRGGASFRVNPEAFLRRDARPGFVGVSSGTTNRPVSTFIPLDWIAARTPVTALFYAAHDLYPRAQAIYDGILPASPGMTLLLICGKLRVPVDRWFSHRISVHSPLERTSYYLLTHLVILTGRASGRAFPRPEFLDIGDLHRIVRWAEQKQRQGCCITTAASNAARIARTAWEMGASLEGATFVVTGEPYTDAKRQALERVGAKGLSRYAYGGGLNVAYACADPRQTDDVHVNEHFLALIRHPEPLPGGGPPIHPLLCTTFSPHAPRLLLNVESGDYATLERRACGCRLGRVGLSLHAHRIRSFEKFTSEGLNYFYGDLYDLFEHTLPSAFGGGPGDYQLVEEEDEQGQTRLTLRVHPDVGAVDEARLLGELQRALSAGSRGNQFMATVWQGAGTVRLSRQAPHTSARGKVLPLHVPR